MPQQNAKQRTDEEWLAELQSPDSIQNSRAWLELYDFLVKHVYWYIRRYSSIPQIAGDLQGQAEEIAQESSLKICLALRDGKYNPALARFLTWATTIAVNTAIDAVRRHLLRPSDHRPQREATADMTDTQSQSRVRLMLSVDDLAEALDLAAAPVDPLRVDLRDFVCRVMTEDLSELQRTICILHYHRGYRIHEIADRLQKSDKAVENVLHQVRVKFSRRAQDEGLEL